MDARMVGKPTLMAIYPEKHEAGAILDGLGKVGYPLNDVSVYYRLKGTDQVLDATTGQVAAGQSINSSDLTPQALAGVETVVLLHPSAETSQAVVGALNMAGQPVILYEGESDVQGRPGGYEREDLSPAH